MRKSGVCPKCSSQQILLVSAVPDAGEFATQLRELHLATVLVGHGNFGSEKLERRGKLSAVMCQGCGFSELYVLDPQAVVPDGKYVVALPRT